MKISLSLIAGVWCLALTLATAEANGGSAAVPESSAAVPESSTTAFMDPAPTTMPPAGQRQLLELPVSASKYNTRPKISNCFDPGSSNFDIFYSYFRPSSGDELLTHSSGVGLAASTFYTQIFGLSVEGMWWKPDSRSVYSLTGSLIGRFPVAGENFAAYAYGGGGGFFASRLPDGATAHVGGGLDIRFDRFDCIGLFVDARYTWADKTENFAVINAGIRFAF